MLNGLGAGTFTAVSCGFAVAVISCCIGKLGVGACLDVGLYTRGCVCGVVSWPVSYMYCVGLAQWRCVAAAVENDNGLRPCCCVVLVCFVQARTPVPFVGCVSVVLLQLFHLSVTCSSILQ